MKMPLMQCIDQFPTVGVPFFGGGGGGGGRSL